MAKLRVDPDFLRQLMHLQYGSVKIIGASFDMAGNTIVLNLQGPDVPEAEEVVCIVTNQRTTARLEKIG